jgi:hypothetical protein
MDSHVSNFHGCLLFRNLLTVSLYTSGFQRQFFNSVSSWTGQKIEHQNVIKYGFKIKMGKYGCQ